MSSIGMEEVREEGIKKKGIGSKMERETEGL